MLGLEFRFAVRSLRRAKTYAVFSVLTLGAAIGTSAAIYTILYAVLLRPLPYEDPDRIVMVRLRTQGYPENVTSYPNYVDLRNGNQTLSELAAFNYENYHLAGDGEPERVVGANVSHNFFPMFGVAPELGGYLSADADFTFPDRRVVLSHGGRDASAATSRSWASASSSMEHLLPSSA